MNLRNTATAGLLLAVSFTLPVQAALHDRGGGLVYDDVLDITWLQDANYAKTSGHDADGKMTWSQAVAWAGNLSYGGYNDWRLPTVAPINGTTFNYNYSWAGNTDSGHNISAIGTPYAGATGSEMSYMFYQNLSNQGYYKPDGVVSGCYVSSTNTCLDNIGPFLNLQADLYWSDTVHKIYPNQNAWTFSMEVGSQIDNNQSFEFYAWAVRDGDITAPVPEPETYALLFAGLGLVGIAARRRKVWLSCCSTHEGVKP